MSQLCPNSVLHPCHLIVMQVIKVTSEQPCPTSAPSLQPPEDSLAGIQHGSHLAIKSTQEEWEELEQALVVTQKQRQAMALDKTLGQATRWGPRPSLEPMPMTPMSTLTFLCPSGWVFKHVALMTLQQPKALQGTC